MILILALVGGVILAVWGVAWGTGMGLADLGSPARLRDVALALAAYAVGGTALAAVLSFTTSLDRLPGRTGLAVLALLAVPVAVLGVLSAALALRGRPRGRALVALVVSVGTLLAWLAMELAVS